VELHVATAIDAQLFRQAQRAARSRPDAEDLLQTVWLAAVEAGRADLTSDANRRWFSGALRKRALYDARTAVRRRNREQSIAALDGPAADVAGPEPEMLGGFLEALPPKLRTTALLILTGHDKHEILRLLQLNEPALRQRIADIRRRWRAEGGSGLDGPVGLSGPLNFGVIRRALLPVTRQPGVILASHDPDGHLFAVRTSRKPEARQQGSG
jgi:DNA-directed RNA polymerase specialized sigma24 family protein